MNRNEIDKRLSYNHPISQCLKSINLSTIFNNSGGLNSIAIEYNILNNKNYNESSIYDTDSGGLSTHTIDSKNITKEFSLNKLTECIKYDKYLDDRLNKGFMDITEINKSIYLSLSNKITHIIKDKLSNLCKSTYDNSLKWYHKLIKYFFPTWEKKIRINTKSKLIDLFYNLLKDNDVINNTNNSFFIICSPNFHLALRLLGLICDSKYNDNISRSGLSYMGKLKADEIFRGFIGRSIDIKIFRDDLYNASKIDFIDFGRISIDINNSIIFDSCFTESISDVSNPYSSMIKKQLIYVLDDTIDEEYKSNSFKRFYIKLSQKLI